MEAKSISNSDDVIHSAHPEFENEYENVKEPDLNEPGNQMLVIGLGKATMDGGLTTHIANFIGKHVELVNLEKEIGIVCKTCGSSRMYDVILKGDVRKRTYIYLRRMGFCMQFSEIL